MKKCRVCGEHKKNLDASSGIDICVECRPSVLLACGNHQIDFSALSQTEVEQILMTARIARSDAKLSGISDLGELEGNIFSQDSSVKGPKKKMKRKKKTKHSQIMPFSDESAIDPAESLDPISVSTKIATDMSKPSDRK